MKTVIIDYGAGNVESVLNALSFVKNNENFLVSNKPSDIRAANHLILPGVGAFGDCMDGLKSVEGLLPEIRKQVLVEKKPFLGICVGMQVLASIGYENGEHQGLGFINGKVEKITAQEGLKIPHMGWNEIVLKPTKHPALKDVKNGEHFYFANSYHSICQNENNVLAQVEYGSKLNAIVAKENILGIQFHPEKSGEAGLLILKNFLNWRP
jgi:glutamine amidotransferase